MRTYRSSRSIEAERLVVTVIRNAKGKGKKTITLKIEINEKEEERQEGNRHYVHQHASYVCTLWEKKRKKRYRRGEDERRKVEKMRIGSHLRTHVGVKLKVTEIGGSSQVGVEKGRVVEHHGFTCMHSQTIVHELAWVNRDLADHGHGHGL